MGSFIPFFLLLSFNHFLPSAARDTLTPSQPLVDGQTLVSSGGYFALGFFSADGSGPTSDRRYLGIWYHNVPVQKVVWVANRENPITTGILSLSPDGGLNLRNSTGGEAVWSANHTSGAVHNPYITILDSGNLVLADGNTTIVWQSFDHPSHALLPGMNLGWDLLRGLEKHLTSWKADNDPSPGNFTFRLKLSASPEMELSKGSVPKYRTGVWDGESWSNVTPMKMNAYFIFHLEMDKEGVYYSYESKNKSVISMLTVSIGGELQRLVWLGGAWRLYWRIPQDTCDTYGTCGADSVCQIGDVQEQCGCLKGFEPLSAADWGLRDYSGGCMRRTALAVCGGGVGGDGFVKVGGVKTPDSTNVTVAAAGEAGFAGCQAACLMNCSCVAFAFVDGKCISWKGKLLDIKEFPTGGEDVYVRLAASDLDSPESGSGKSKLPVAAIVVPLVLVSIAVFCFGLYLIKRKRKHGVADGYVKESRGKEMELPLFDMLAIENATDNFCYANKLGEGGFGPVYKGKLGDGQDIAVKRLSRYSVQGLDEFMNEVMLIAKLQHRNLVRLLGCCIQKEERLLIYEYMPNKSLDAFIFDKANSCHLDWKKRFEIILGIARGLLYLHQDSRLKIIHRDLKVSNVLLDKEMNPKISDFGMARIFRGDQMQESTEKVVGTYGYMSPEYAMHGIFSVKSDVFSFGVIVLEILTGKKNRVFDPNEPHVSLVGHAWKLWSENRSLELVDDAMQYGYSESEVLRCMQVGLLCVQELSDDRPTMASVVLMLGSEGMLLSQPNRPGFYPREGSKLKDFSTSDHVSTGNDISLTMVHGR